MIGRSIALGPLRCFVCDLLEAAKRIPTVPVQRRMNLHPVRSARALCDNRPAWAVLFMKGFALVAREVPELRRAYVTLPWARLYEYPVSVASIAVEREYHGERGVLVGRIADPATLSITELDQRLKRISTAPVDSIKTFRRQIRFSQFPRFVRKLGWWLGLNLPRSRGNLFGTFGLTVYSALGAESLHPLSPMTCTLNYGVIDADGNVDVRIVYDHRVLDGATVARALNALEQVLNQQIALELRSEGAPARPMACVA